MIKVILKYWWTIPGLMAVLMVLDCIFLVANLPTLESVVEWLLLLTGIAILASWIILALNKQWKKFLFSFLLSILVGAVMAILVAVIGFRGLYAHSSDYFGREHSIPEGMEYSIPFEEYSDPAIDIDRNGSLQIWNGIQGGIYKYDFYYGPLPAGEIYLRCYEVTENIRLSADRIRESSKVTIDTTSSFSKVVDQHEFTIYEGDWGDYYAARIEVWHKDAKTGRETKLMEKVYRVEGWMR